MGMSLAAARETSMENANLTYLVEVVEGEGVGNVDAGGSFFFLLLGSTTLSEQSRQCCSVVF